MPCGSACTSVPPPQIPRRGAEGRDERKEMLWQGQAAAKPPLTLLSLLRGGHRGCDAGDEHTSDAPGGVMGLPGCHPQCPSAAHLVVGEDQLLLQLLQLLLQLLLLLVHPLPVTPLPLEVLLENFHLAGGRGVGAPGRGQTPLPNTPVLPSLTPPATPSARHSGWHDGPWLWSF